MYVPVAVGASLGIAISDELRRNKRGHDGRPPWCCVVLPYKTRDKKV